MLGSLVLGALAGSAYAYRPGYYGGGYWQNRPVYDAWGNFAGYAPVRACYQWSQFNLTAKKPRCAGGGFKFF
ncbi:MAG TPA: hypothetical protein VLZ74_07125 [Methylocella sp.]|nr:hypothetical protein [Methylocella sp.]